MTLPEYITWQCKTKTIIGTMKGDHLQHQLYVNLHCRVKKITVVHTNQKHSETMVKAWAVWNPFDFLIYVFSGWSFGLTLLSVFNFGRAFVAFASCNPCVQHRTTLASATPTLWSSPSLRYLKARINMNSCELGLQYNRILWWLSTSRSPRLVTLINLKCALFERQMEVST